MSVASLAHAILEAGILDPTPVERRAQQAKSARQFLEFLVAEDMPEPALITRLARAMGIPRYDPNERSPEPEALALLDPGTADEIGALPVALRGGGTMLWIAVCDPTDEALQAEIERRTGKRVKACLIGPRELSRAMQVMAAGRTTGTSHAPVSPSMQPAPPLPGLPALPNGNGFDGNRSSGGLEPSLPPGVRHPVTGPVSRPPSTRRLEEDIQQVRAVVKVLTQMLVDKGLVDGEELKRRLRAERDRKV